MSTPRPTASVSRRSALAGLGAGGLGVAFAASPHGASAQDASPAAMAGHPIVGTWIITRDVTNTTQVPVVVIFTADGGFIDPGQGAAGAWETTGPHSAAMTIIPFIGDGYGVVRATWEIDESGETMGGSAALTILGTDGTVMATPPSFNSTAIRLHVEPMDKQGSGVPGFPVWTPAPAATPTS